MPFRRPGYSGFGTSPEREDSNAWDDFVSEHPHLAEEFRGRLPAWFLSRKRRGSRERDSTPEGRNRHLRDFFLDDFPSEFRQYIPSEWTGSSGSSDAPNTKEAPQTSTHQPPKFERQQSSEKATQTVEGGPLPNLNQHKLRNTVDLGQKTASELGNLDDNNRNQRSMSAPPDNRVPHCTSANNMNNMGNPQQQPESQKHIDANESANLNNKQPNVRHIPIFVEGRDEPVINTQPDSSATFAESRPTPPKEQYFMEHDMPQSFHPTPHFSRAFGSPFKGFSNKNMTGFGPKLFNQGNEQPQQKFKQQQPTHSTKPQAGPHYNDAQANHPSQFQKEDSFQPQASSNAPKPQTFQTHVQPEPQAHAPSEPPRDTTDSTDTQKPPQQSHHLMNDPIERIQSIQKDVLDLMSKVEVFKGTSKKDKEYVYLDEMLTRNLIKLDDIETEGKENIRLARKEAIKCIQQCIAVLEAKADSNADMEAKQTPNNSQMEQEESNSGAESVQQGNMEQGSICKEEGGQDDASQDPKPMETDANSSSQ